ncbi:hypothetical protein N2600_32045 (plasmid) [Rhizobium sp. WSM1274]|jgi:hypothetical protein|nr:hypothetical protein [Rhizobium laguerreae]UWM85832.1 hypothetical protein N2A41_32045 [Rhizobium leguminosarum bv. viciae]UWU32452.1 hypothetical protein N2600_32045 [Rhizobium leguminosarum bv. viciae]
MLIRAGLSLETARHVANVVTNEFEHDGVCQSAAVLRRMMTLVREQGGPLAS